MVKAKEVGNLIGFYWPSLHGRSRQIYAVIILGAEYSLQTHGQRFSEAPDGELGGRVTGEAEQSDEAGQGRDEDDDAAVGVRLHVAQNRLRHVDRPEVVDVHHSSDLKTWFGRFVK